MALRFYYSICRFNVCLNDGFRVQAQRVESIAHTRFKAGFTDVQLWLDAQARLRSTECSLVLNRFNQLNNQVNFYKALGLGATSGKIACRQGAIDFMT